MPSVPYRYALVAWCSETGVSLPFTASTFQFLERRIFRRGKFQVGFKLCRFRNPGSHSRLIKTNEP